MDAEFVLIMALGMSAVIFLFMIMIAQSQQIDKQVRDKLTKLITDVGGTEIEIKPVPVYGSQGVCNYVVYYTDKRGYIQEHRITHLTNFWGKRHGELRWDKPLEVVQHEPHSSKEQLISEMDTEIQRLRSALAVADAEHSPKHR